MKAAEALKKLRKLRVADRLLVLGVTESGKSYFTKLLILRRFIAEGRAVIVFDVLDEYSAEKGGPCKYRMTVREFVAEAKRAADIQAGRASGHSVLLEAGVTIAVVPESDPDTDRQGVAQEFVQVARVVKWRGDVVFVVEEVGAFGDEVAELLEGIATRWRHFGVLLVLVAQFATAVPPGPRKQCMLVVSFLQVESTDLIELGKKCGKAFRHRVRRQRLGECELFDGTAPPEDDDGTCALCGASLDEPEGEAEDEERDGRDDE